MPSDLAARCEHCGYAVEGSPLQHPCPECGRLTIPIDPFDRIAGRWIVLQMLAPFLGVTAFSLFLTWACRRIDQTFQVEIVWAFFWPLVPTASLIGPFADLQPRPRADGTLRLKRHMLGLAGSALLFEIGVPYAISACA